MGLQLGTVRTSRRELPSVKSAFGDNVMSKMVMTGNCVHFAFIYEILLFISYDKLCFFIYFVVRIACSSN